MKPLTPISFLLGIVILLGSCAPQSPSSPERALAEAPDLVIGIVVDQMRPDFVYRYWDHYGDDGFRRLVREGFSFRNARFRHIPTATGPGHAAPYTGATPSVHGVIGNSWYVRDLDRTVNVIEDVGSGYEGVGTEPDYEGEKSPNNMLTTTFGDELHLHTNERSRTVSISFKDRGAILPGGHTGEAYWFEGATGNFVTSTYYREELPEWLRAFNDRDLPREHLSRPWETLLPMESYVESMADDNPYEGGLGVEGATTFPHDLPALVEEHGHGPGLIQWTGFASELLTDLALAALEGEELGRGETADILAIGYSSPDYIGHRFGPASKEVQDTYVRLDRQIARLLDHVDEEYGMENVLVFLTADHGVVHIPHYLRDLGIPTGHPDSETHVMGEMLAELREYLAAAYGADFLLDASAGSLYLDHDFIEENGLDLETVRADVKRFVLTLDPVGGALTADALNRAEFTRGVRAHAQEGFHPKRSGDVLVWLAPQTVFGTDTGGTTHGSPWAYDTHVPLHFYGSGVPAGQSTERVHVSDIAPTIATFLNAPFPSGTVGDPLNHLMRE